MSCKASNKRMIERPAFSSKVVEERTPLVFNEGLS